MRSISLLLPLVMTSFGCNGWNVQEWWASRTAPPPTCDLERLNEAMNGLNSNVVVASSLVDGIWSACGDVLSPSLVWGLGQWSGEPLRFGELTFTEPLCDVVAPNIPLEPERPAQMLQVFEQCSIERDGLFDETEFLKASGPYAGLVASRLYAELSLRGVSGSRAVSLAHLVAGMSKRTQRNVYGDFASRLWRVPLQSGSVSRIEKPSCTPVVVAEGDWIRWQDREWHPMTSSGVKSEHATSTNPAFVSGNESIGAWQSSQEECLESGETVLLAIDSTLSMGGVRPLLWTLDGLAGYRPAMVVRLDAEGPAYELMPLGAVPFRVVDVLSRLQNQQDGLFLLPESSAMLGHESEEWNNESRMNAWLPGIRIQIDPAGWSVWVDDEESVEGSEGIPQNVLTSIASHHDQIRSQGVVLTVSDQIETGVFIEWLVALHAITDRVWLDARSPDRTTAVP